MAEVGQYLFTHKEVVEALVKQHGLHEGLWSLYVEFGLAAANLVPPGSEGGVMPAAIVSILKIGLQKGKAEDALTVNAAKVNPAIS